MRAVGEVRSVEFIVKSTGHNAKEGLTYLNSEQNHKWNTNFAVVVGKADAGRFVAAGGVAGLEKFYLGKQVQVSGKVEKFKAVTGIRATGPDERQAGARPTRSSADAR